jgi:protein-tyrosine phosphatase
MGYLLNYIFAIYAGKQYKFTEYDFSSESDTIDKIKDYLYLGSCKSALDVIHNKNLNITNILNLSGYNLYAPKFKIHQIAIDDDVSFPINNYFNVTNEIINNVRKNNEKILVHCRAGHSRSPTIIIAYLMKYENMTFDEAYNYVNDIRHIAPNNGFIEILKNTN